MVLYLPTLSVNGHSCAAFAQVNGRHVTVSTDVPSQPSSSRSASSKPAPTRVRQPTETSSDFEILDLDGNVEMRCDAKGYVYVHGRASSIGMGHVAVVPQVSFFHTHIHVYILHSA